MANSMKHTFQINISPKFYPRADVMVYVADAKGAVSMDRVSYEVTGKPTTNYVSIAIYIVLFICPYISSSPLIVGLDSSVSFSFRTVLFIGPNTRILWSLIGTRNIQPSDLCLLQNKWIAVLACRYYLIVLIYSYLMFYLKCWVLDFLPALGAFLLCGF